jgi:signal transduction histidine kinase
MWRQLHTLIPRLSGEAFGGVPLAVIAAIAVSIALLLGNAGLLVINSARTLDANAQYARSYEIKRALSSFQATVTAAQSAQRGYLITGQPSDRESFFRAARAWHTEIDRLRHLSSGQRALLTEIDELAAGTSAAVGRLEQAIERTDQSIKRGNDTPAADERDQERAAATVATDSLDEVHATLKRLMSTEQARIDALRAEVSRHIWVTVGVAVFATIVTLGVLVGLQRLLQRYVGARAAAETALRKVNEQLNREVEERTSELTDLSRHLIRVAEEEKAKLARELHDTLGSNLTAISMDLGWVAKRLPDSRDDLRERLQRASRMLAETVELKHQVIEGLRPSHLDNLGLTFALRMQCKEFNRLTGMPCSIEVLEDFDDLDPALSIVLYRVAQEALTNVMKHAHARNVRVSLRREAGGLRLRVQDDGVGFIEGSAAKRTSHGLVGMRERVRQVGGSLRVTAAQESGTLVDVFIPIGHGPVLRDMYLQDVGHS